MSGYKVGFLCCCWRARGKLELSFVQSRKKRSCVLFLAQDGKWEGENTDTTCAFTRVKLPVQGPQKFLMTKRRNHTGHSSLEAQATGPPKRHQNRETAPIQVCCKLNRRARHHATHRQTITTYQRTRLCSVPRASQRTPRRQFDKQ